MNTKVNIAGVELKNPVMTCSGTFGLRIVWRPRQGRLTPVRLRRVRMRILSHNRLYLRSQIAKRFFVRSAKTHFHLKLCRWTHAVSLSAGKRLREFLLQPFTRWLQ